MESKSKKVMDAVESVYRLNLTELSTLCKSIATEVRNEQLSIKEMLDVLEEVHNYMDFVLARLTGGTHHSESSKIMSDISNTHDGLIEFMHKILDIDEHDDLEDLEDLPF